MGNLNHRAGWGPPMVNLYNGRELDQNLCIVEMAGGPVDLYSENTRESCSHKDFQNDPISSRLSCSPMSYHGTEVMRNTGEW